MDMRQILKYLADLSENNNWEWYHVHRMENDAANTQFEELVQTLIFRIGIGNVKNLIMIGKRISQEWLVLFTWKGMFSFIRRAVLSGWRYRKISGDISGWGESVLFIPVPNDRSQYLF